MSLFHKSAKGSHSQKSVSIYQDNILIYQGKWNELPFTEKIITEYSIRFFNDPDPCYIHQDAVRVRLLAELEEKWENTYAEASTDWYAALSAYTGMDGISEVIFS
ncbi:MAG TPA: hypothetical protein H9761_17410 [Candidatus Eisenbergiella merdavium]|uniref:Uncharacterized protein n=1 Tax=Candidatus Eisenbergiella merdavium TaxID=2838551 RepID=A0A9D2NIH1_9FIRM|nr:hypothetical protein [Candidatus Eisenbergiella merdavium]